MDYEEKYKDLVKRLNKAREEKGVYTFNSVLDVVAPELKIDESEDERIRQLLIRFVTYDMSDNYSDDFTPADCVAWLEKQGKNNMGISEATKQELENSLNKALEKETPESCNEFLEKQGSKKETLKERNICDTCEDSNGCLIPCCAKLLEKQGEQKMKTPEESLGVDSDTYNKIVDECIYGKQKPAEWHREDEQNLTRGKSWCRF